MKKDAQQMLVVLNFHKFLLTFSQMSLLSVLLYYITVLQCDLPPLRPHRGEAPAEIRTRAGRARGRDHHPSFFTHVNFCCFPFLILQFFSFIFTINFLKHNFRFSRDNFNFPLSLSIFSPHWSLIICHCPYYMWLQFVLGTFTLLLGLIFICLFFLVHSCFFTWQFVNCFVFSASFYICNNYNFYKYF